jgi:phenylpropionate dioxygenase-like ring-hydroxylating dioxygenase large terminal subunit
VSAPQREALEAFVCEQWYVAALADEVTRDLQPRELLGRPLLLYRALDGSIAALEDVCAHRWMPLSMGRLVDDDVVCGYHGFRFDRCGECVAVPSQEGVPSRATVRSYPVVERGPLVWVWTGAPDRADQARIPDTHELTDPGFRFVHVTVDIAAHYLLMHENVMDQTHFHHLHRDFAGSDDWDRGTIDLEVSGNRVVRTHVSPPAPPPPVAAFAGVDLDAVVESTSVGTFVQPGLNTSTTTHRECESGRAGILQTFHVFTPCNERSTRYTIMVGTNHPPAPIEQLHAGVERATFEDKHGVEAIQRVADRYAPSTEVSVRADQPGLQVRRVVRELVAAESDGSR